MGALRSGRASAVWPGVVFAFALCGGGALGEAPVPAASLGTCGGAGCHDELAPADPKHRARQVTCLKCHATVTDGQAKHEGALDDWPAEKMCAQAGCHPDQSLGLASGSHKDSGCDACHGGIHEGFTRIKWASCKGACHSEQAEAFATSAHASAKDPVTCGQCHGDLHAPKSKKDPLSPVSKVMQVTMCGECHNKEYERAFRTSVHGQGLLRSGLAVAPTCIDCHGSHGILKTKDPASKVSKWNVVATCGTCHTFIVDRWKTSAHGQRFAQDAARHDGKQTDGGTALTQLKASPAPDAHPQHLKPQEGPVCTTCHLGHLTFDPRINANHLQMVDTCKQCHLKESETYRDSFHGKATRLGMGMAATCADCHSPHEMLPASDPRSTVNPKNLEATCGKCHAHVSASFVQFRPHSSPADAEAGPIHLVWLLMTTLLLSVLGFFTVHALLWLQRSIVALRRGELRRPEQPGELWVRRFIPLHRYIHLTIIGTFLLLAATGLPIKFSSVGWASVLEGLFGNIVIARGLHRLAGVLTFCYGAVYLGYLVREVLVRKRRELLWGWQSMVPNRKDLLDLKQNLRWFLYRGPPPKLDRWAYWEKFDFLAVFWGVPVIGLSGLMMWFPMAVTTVLPGWALNIAYLVHSDEALLATGFIFVFHLFHTHLRPEAFPLDTVMFLGAMPLSRFTHERPEEHARLVASGELERLLVPRPDDRTLRRAYQVGYTALTLALVLAVFLVAASANVLLK